MTPASASPERKALCLTPTFGTTTSEAERLLTDRGVELVRADADDASSIRLLSDAAALIVGTQKVDTTMLSRGPQLKIVAKHGAGTDNIDIRAAEARGVVVTNAAIANALAVAEFAIAAMLALARGIVSSDALLRLGTWTPRTGRQLDGSTAGIIGLGAIGKLVAVRANALGMRVVYYDLVPPTASPRANEWERLPLDEVLALADFLTIHVPLSDTTRKMVGTAELARMKPTAYLVNLSRGGIVDEAALAAALAGGRLAGAALDVFEQEPVPRRSPLLHVPAMILTPHMAGYTEESLAAMSIAVAESVVAALDGEDPPGRVTAADPR